jgi:23S rRNA (guanosine2251-2'-O)-methyltransferase
VKLNSKQLRVSEPTEEELAQIVRRPLWIILDNVLDTYNIGGIFRLADAVGASEIIMCGGSETPPSSRIHKSAVGTEKWVPWRYFADAKSAIEKLKIENGKLKIIAVEQDERAVPLGQLAPYPVPPLSKGRELKGGVAIVVGHETNGCAKETLDACDMIVEIPMWGVNKSLNVIVSTAIVVYKLLDEKQTI